MPMPAAWAWRWTVCTSHCSTSLRGCVITWAPVPRLAIHLDAIREISEPPKPNTAAMTSRPPVLPSWMPNTPCRMDITTPSSTSTARLVARNNATRLNISTPVRATGPLHRKMWQAAAGFKGQADSRQKMQHRHASEPRAPLAAEDCYRGRFAPSPTGDLHPGSLVAALGSWLLARQAGGAWLIRVEDVDPPREVAGATQRQIEALTAFGLASDEPVVRQSQRGALYAAALERLLADGHAFECHCSRS